MGVSTELEYNLQRESLGSHFPEFFFNCMFNIEDGEVPKMYPFTFDNWN